MIRKFIFFSLFYLCPFLLNAYDLPVIRELFHKSVEDEQAAKDLLLLLNDVDRNDKPLLIGYKGISYMMSAKHAVNPFTKIKYFNRGKELLDLAIEKDNEDIELHFLRFGVQTNAPFFLGYNSNITNDKEIILNGIPFIKDATVKKNVIDYMLKSNECTNKERKWLMTQTRNT